MSPWEAPVGALVCILGVAAAVLLFAFRNRPRVRGYLGLPVRQASPAEEAAVEQILGQVDTDPVDDFRQHVDDALAIVKSTPRPGLLGWCHGCGQLLRFCCAFHAVEHIQSHPADFAAWETELNNPTGRTPS